MSDADYNQRNFYAAAISVVLSFVGIVVAIYIAGIQNSQSTTLDSVQEQTTIQVPIKDNQGLRNALSKPLEGTWKFKTLYTKFHDLEGDWESTGKVMITWRPDNNRYDLFFAASIIERGKIGENLVTYYAEGLLAADASGIVQEPFSLEIEYIGRTGLDGFDDPSFKQFSYKDCRFVRDENGQINKITSKFQSSKSEGDVTFTFEER